MALGFGPGEDLHYQYRLDGAAATGARRRLSGTVNFANLAPGTYRFEVRAISADGIRAHTGERRVHDRAAGLAALVVPDARSPFASLAVYAVYRYRLARAVEIATMRTRIATDLHDDIGANLTKIAILSEVARQQLDGEQRTRVTVSRRSPASPGSRSRR